MADLLVFAIGFSAPFSVHLIGTLPIAEILILCVLPIVLLLRGKRVWTRRTQIVFGLMALWLLGQILTDIYRDTPRFDWIRGDAAIVFFAFTFAAVIGLIANSDRRKVLIIAGYALGGLLAARIQPSEAAADDPWKWGYAYYTGILAALVSCYFFKKARYGAMLIPLAGVLSIDLTDNFRSHMLFLVLTVFLIAPIIPDRIGRLRIMPRPGSAARVAVVVSFVCAGAMAAGSMVHLATTKGWINEDAREKNEEQSQMAGGILLGGRPEILVSSKAVWDSPILGHGSWPKDPKYLEMLFDMRAQSGASDSAEEEEEASEGLIPSHSHLMGAWVWAGVLGVLFWVYALTLVAKGIVGVSFLRPPLAPVYALILVGVAWDILFSPFSATAIVRESIAIVIALDLLNAKPSAVVERVGAWRRMNRLGIHRGSPASAWQNR